MQTTDFRTFLLKKNLIPAGQLQELDTQAVAGEPLYYQLLKKHPEQEQNIWTALGEFLRLELVDPRKITLSPDLTRIVPARLAHQHSIVPLALEGTRLKVAMADPGQFGKCEEFGMLIRQQSTTEGEPAPLYTVEGQLARPSHVAEMIKSLYGIGANTVQDVLDNPQASQITILEPEVVDLTTFQAAGEDAAIIRFVNELLLEAVKINASDIHLEPFEKELRVRFRVDGMLRTESVPEKLKDLEASIISRIKIMSRLNIAEKRLPQDGQIRLKVMDRPIDVRVSVLPTMFGQGLAMRLLDQQMSFRYLDNVGMPSDYLQLYRKVLTLAHGVILVTGPTGSGKTTTLYASINVRNRNDTKIITVEDPIEYQLDGIVQIQVNPAIQLNFATILRHILRHDPDCIMVGEIRDRETAQIAISAAMTGHLVFSTLHTNDASSAPVRLLEMGVEPYLVSSSLEAVAAQRLIRMLCPYCRHVVRPQSLPRELANTIDGAVLFESKGCPVCRHSGYKDRTAIFEMFTVNDPLRQLIINRATASEIRQENLSRGMRTLYQSGLEKVRQGITSLSEVYRVAREETIDMKEFLKKEN
jgi:type II secretory ATPase GspE/PulE/Tfp pilus assembly ATPase PilB-like protein